MMSGKKEEDKLRGKFRAPAFAKWARPTSQLRKGVRLGLSENNILWYFKAEVRGC